jgi:hypothetical protein
MDQLNTYSRSTLVPPESRGTGQFFSSVPVLRAKKQMGSQAVAVVPRRRPGLAEGGSCIPPGLTRPLVKRQLVQVEIKHGDPRVIPLGHWVATRWHVRVSKGFQDTGQGIVVLVNRGMVCGLI